MGLRGLKRYRAGLASEVIARFDRARLANAGSEQDELARVLPEVFRADSGISSALVLYAADGNGIIGIEVDAAIETSSHLSWQSRGQLKNVRELLVVPGF